MKGKKCPTCGLISVQGAYQCSHCETKLNRVRIHKYEDSDVESSKVNLEGVNNITSLDAKINSNLVKCGHCGEEISRTASKCPHCGRKKTNSASLTISIFILGFFFIFLIRSCSSFIDSEKNFDPATECRSKVAAVSQAYSYVRNSLKSPSSASFPYNSYKHSALGNCIHLIEGAVDADNSFGASIRSYYRVKVQYSMKHDSWNLLELSVK